MNNGSKYDFHLIIKNLASKFYSRDFGCFDKNTEKYINFLFL